MFVSEISLRDADAYFKKKFGRWIYRLHRYILFAEGVNFNDEMDFCNLVIDFCKDRNILRLAHFSVKEFVLCLFVLKAKCLTCLRLCMFFMSLVKILKS